jgi:hypothetical protein
MAVQVLAVLIPHRRARVGVTGSDLHVAQVSASVETGREQCLNHAECVSLERAGWKLFPWLVITGACQFCGVAGPVGSGVVHPVDGGARG